MLENSHAIFFSILASVLEKQEELKADAETQDTRKVSEMMPSNCKLLYPRRTSWQMSGKTKGGILALIPLANTIVAKILPEMFSHCPLTVT